MATEGTLHFGQLRADRFAGPVLEIGSAIQPGYEQYSPRALHPGLGDDDYLGVDIAPGPGVDLVADLTVDPLPERRFRTIHCHCVLEHVPQVQRLASAIEELLEPGGWLFVSVPFAWRIHRIPMDLWRFTPQGLDYLFPRVAFAPEDCAVSVRHGDRFFPVDEPPELPLGERLADFGRPTAALVRLLRRLHLADDLLARERAVLLESNLMFLGQRVDEPTYTFLEA